MVASNLSLSACVDLCGTAGMPYRACGSTFRHRTIVARAGPSELLTLEMRPLPLPMRLLTLSMWRCPVRLWSRMPPMYSIDSFWAMWCVVPPTSIDHVRWSEPSFGKRFPNTTAWNFLACSLNRHFFAKLVY